jgi:hypothetical protein
MQPFSVKKCDRGFSRSFCCKLDSAIKKDGVQSVAAWLAFYRSCGFTDMEITEFCRRVVEEGFDLVWMRAEDGSAQKWLCIGSSI